MYVEVKEHIVACFPGNATSNLWVLDLNIHQAELQLIITPLILL
jgi:hypothetical protein